MHLTKLTKKTASASHNLPKFLQTVFCTFPLSLLRGKCHNRATTIAPGSNWLNKQRIITHSPLKKKVDSLRLYETTVEKEPLATSRRVMICLFTETYACLEDLLTGGREGNIVFNVQPL